MKGIILVNSRYETPNTVYQAERMKEELEKLSLDVSVMKNSGDLCYIKEGKIEKPDFDFCIYFDKDPYVPEAMARAGVRVFNSPDSIRICDDKMLTHLALSSAVRMPDTLSGTFTYQKGEVSEKDIFSVEERFIYPVVVKLNNSSLGAGVRLAKNREELRSILAEFSSKPYLVQEFVDSSVGVDYRIIVVGGKYVCGMRRKSENDFRSNVELGGTGENVDIPQSFIELAQKSAQILNLDYCGVDVLSDNGEPVLCEVNSNAFFGGVERVTGVNVAREYAKYVKKELENGKK